MKKVKLCELKQRLWNAKLINHVQQSSMGKALSTLRRLGRENPFPAQYLLILLYRAILDFTYLMVLNHWFEYEGYQVNLIPLQYVVSWLMLATLAPIVVFIQQQERRPSSVLLSGLNYLYFIPMTSFCGCRGTEFLFCLIVFFYWTVLLLLQIKVPVLCLKPMKATNVHRIFKILTVFSIIFVMAVSGYYTGFRLKLNIQDVYEIRSEAATYAMPGAVTYLLSWMTAVLSILILYWLQKKRLVPVLLLLITYLFYYSISALKSVFFLLFIVVLVYFLYRRWMLKWVAPLLSTGVLLCCVIEKVGILLPLSLFVRRLMYVPSRLSYNIWEFMQNNPQEIFRGAILGKLGFEPVYSTTYASVIGEFLKTPQTLCNNGLIGDMLFNLPPVVGIITMPILLILCFRLLDASASKLKPAIFGGVCVHLINSFCNATWSTVLLTHGFLVLCVLLYLFPLTEEKSKNEVL